MKPGYRTRSSHCSIIEHAQLVLPMIALCLAACLGSLPASAQDEEALRKTVATGAGATPDEAQKNALITAVEQAVGVLVDAETIVDKNDVIQDKIITASNAFVERFDVLKRWQEGGTERCRIVAYVRTRALIKKLQENRVKTIPVEGKNIAVRIETEEAAKQSAAEVVKSCLADLPQKVLVVTATGKPVPISATRLRIPIELSVDMRAYDQAMRDIEPKLSKIARLKESGASTYVKQEEVDNYDLPLVVPDPDRFKQLDPNPIVPPAGRLLQRAAWGGLYPRVDPYRDERALTERVIKKATSMGQHLVLLTVMTAMSANGAARITIFGVDEEAVQDLPRTPDSTVVIRVRLLDADNGEITSADTPYRGKGMILTAKVDSCKGWPLVGVWPGRLILEQMRNRFASCWFGNAYIDVAPDDVKRVTSLSLSLRWKPCRD